MIVMLVIIIIFRAIMVRLSSLVVLVVTIFILISCTQEMVNNTQSGACTFISTTASLTGVIANATREIVADCPVVSSGVSSYQL